MALRLFGDGRIEEVSELEIEANTATDTPLTLIGASGQTANILEVKDSTDAVILNVESGGDMKINSNVVITEDSINSYVDPTNDQTVFAQRMFA
jgi:hypothetical protein